MQNTVEEKVDDTSQRKSASSNLEFHQPQFSNKQQLISDQQTEKNAEVQEAQTVVPHIKSENEVIKAQSLIFISMQELLKVEKHYVVNLQNFMDYIYKPVEDEKIVTHEEFICLFRNLKGILELEKSMLQILRSGIEKKLEVNFESICNNVIDMLYGYIIYPEFTSNDIVDDQLYQQLRATNIKFNLKMEQVTYAGYDYQVLRSLPKQQYFNLQNIFQKIVDKIKADLPEKKMCIRVLDKIKELIIKANNNMGQVQATYYVNQLCQILESEDDKNTITNIKSEYVSDFTLSLFFQNQFKPVKLYLFKDCLEVLENVPKTKQYKILINKSLKNNNLLIVHDKNHQFKVLQHLVGVYFNDGDYLLFNCQAYPNMCNFINNLKEQNKDNLELSKKQCSIFNTEIVNGQVIFSVRIQIGDFVDSIRINYNTLNNIYAQYSEIPKLYKHMPTFEETKVDQNDSDQVIEMKKMKVEYFLTNILKFNMFRRCDCGLQYKICEYLGLNPIIIRMFEEFDNYMLLPKPKEEYIQSENLVKKYFKKNTFELQDQEPLNVPVQVQFLDNQPITIKITRNTTAEHLLQLVCKAKQLSRVSQYRLFIQEQIEGGNRVLENEETIYSTVFNGGGNQTRTLILKQYLLVDQNYAFQEEQSISIAFYQIENNLKKKPTALGRDQYLELISYFLFHKNLQKIYQGEVVKPMNEELANYLPEEIQKQNDFTSLINTIQTNIQSLKNKVDKEFCSKFYQKDLQCKDLQVKNQIIKYLLVQYVFGSTLGQYPYAHILKQEIFQVDASKEMISEMQDQEDLSPLKPYLLVTQPFEARSSNCCLIVGSSAVIITKKDLSQTLFTIPIEKIWKIEVYQKEIKMHIEELFFFTLKFLTFQGHYIQKLITEYKEEKSLSQRQQQTMNTQQTQQLRNDGNKK